MWSYGVPKQLSSHWFFIVSVPLFNLPSHLSISVCYVLLYALCLCRAVVFTIQWVWQFLSVPLNHFLPLLCHFCIFHIPHQLAILWLIASKIEWDSLNIPHSGTQSWEPRSGKGETQVDIFTSAMSTHSSWQSWKAWWMPRPMTGLTVCRQLPFVKQLRP